MVHLEQSLCFSKKDKLHGGEVKMAEMQILGMDAVGTESCRVAREQQESKRGWGWLEIKQPGYAEASGGS